MTTISTLHKFLEDSIGQERLRLAKLVVDNPQSQITGTRRKRTNHSHSDGCVFSSSPTVSGSTTATNNIRAPSKLHSSSIPSLPAVASRWESGAQKTNDCLSPPMRTPRRLSPTLFTNNAISSGMDDIFHNACSNDESCSLRTSCNLPKYPSCCWDSNVAVDESMSSPDDEEKEILIMGNPSPTSVRSGLDEIIGGALKQCPELEDDLVLCEEEFSEMIVR